MSNERIKRIVEVTGCSEDVAYAWNRFLVEFQPTREELERLIKEFPPYDYGNPAENGF